MLDPFTKKRIEKIMNLYIKHKNAGRFQQQAKLTYVIHEDTVTLLEKRPVFVHGQWTEQGIAQFRLRDHRWSIYWLDRKNTWHLLDNIKPNADFEKQLNIVEQDIQGIFQI